VKHFVFVCRPHPLPPPYRAPHSHSHPPNRQHHNLHQTQQTADLKPALSKALNAILQPVRDHFANNPEAAALLKQVRAYKVTR
jgi:hypothetical protein